MSPNGLKGVAFVDGATGFTKLSKLTNAAFSPKNDWGVFVCGFFDVLVSESSNPSKLLTKKAYFQLKNIEKRRKMYELPSLLLFLAPDVRGEDRFVSFALFVMISNSSSSLEGDVIAPTGDGRV